MPATGLPDVKQKIDLDASGYVRGSDEIVIQAIRMAKENRETLEALAELNEGLGGMRAVMTDVRNDFERYIAINRQVIDVQREMTRTSDALADSARLQANAANALIDKYASLGDAAHQVTEEQHAIAQSFIDSMEPIDRLTAIYGGHEEAVRRSNEIMDEQVDRLVNLRTEIIKTGETVAKTSIFATPFLGAGGRASDTSAFTGSNSIADYTASLVKAQEAAKAAEAGITAAQVAGLAAAKSGGGGGTGGIDTAIMAAMSGGGGGGGFGLGRAAIESAAVGAFIKRWYPVAHWVMMLSNELLATIGPATVAAGMGGLVGMQGAEQVIPRALAIFDTAESLGGSLGITAGQAVGLKNAPLQTAQNLATGGAIELTGAGINALKAGAGNAFIQLGSNTVAMFDRFAATMTNEFKSGLGKQLGNIVSGGTGYLQQLGDVLANIGDVFLHVAPNLPGAGGDILSVLQGATKGLAGITGWLGAGLGPILSFEAGARWGPTLVGGAARGLSAVSGGLLGTVARTATAEDVAAGLAASEGDVIAGTGLAGAMGGMGAIGIGGLAAAAFTANKAFTFKTHAQLSADATMAAINQMGFAQGVPPIISAMQAMAAVPVGGTGEAGAGTNVMQGFGKVIGGIGHLKPSELFTGVAQEWHGLFQTVGINKNDPSNYTVAQQALQNLSNTMVNALGAGQQVATEWKKVTGSTVDMGKASDIATMAQLQLGSAFEKNGKLTSTAKTMIDNLQAGYQAMNFSGGQFGSAVAAQTAMSGLQHSQISDVNSAYDQLLQTVTGGASNASSFFGALGGAPVTHKVGGLNFQAPPAFKAYANALTSFTSAAGASAWNVLTNSQSGLIPSLGNQTDQLRIWQSMGALQPGQTTQMAAFQLQQLLPMARKSPAALAMLSTIAQEFGGPAMGGGSQEQNFKKIADWTDKYAANAKTYNQNMNAGTVAASQIPRDAEQYVHRGVSKRAGCGRRCAGFCAVLDADQGFGYRRRGEAVAGADDNRAAERDQEYAGAVFDSADAGDLLQHAAESERTGVYAGRGGRGSGVCDRTRPGGDCR